MHPSSPPSSLDRANYTSFPSKELSLEIDDTDKRVNTASQVALFFSSEEFNRLPSPPPLAVEGEELEMLPPFLPSQSPINDYTFPETIALASVAPPPRSELMGDTPPIAKEKQPARRKEKSRAAPLSNNTPSSFWTVKRLEKLKKLFAKYGNNWDKIAKEMGEHRKNKRAAQLCSNAFFSFCNHRTLKEWTAEEDQKLLAEVAKAENGQLSWHSIAESLEGRSYLECYVRYKEL